MLQAITTAIGLAIGYFFNKASIKLWRLLIGFLIGFVVGWVAGVIIWAFVFMSNDPHAAIVAGMTKSFLFAIVGSSMGVYFGRRKAKLQTPNKTVNTDTAL
jgi:hypothetical protein